MKKLCLLFSLCLILALASCGEGASTAPASTDGAPTSSEEVTAPDTVPSSAAPTSEAPVTSEAPAPTQSSAAPATSSAAPAPKPTTPAPKPTTPAPTAPAHVHSFSSATCTQPKTCSCGETEGSPLGHSYSEGVCTRCGAKDPDYKPTSVLKKQGKWECSYLKGQNEFVTITLYLCYGDQNSLSAGWGVRYDSLEWEMPQEMVEEVCTLWEGVYYYVGEGGGEEIETTVESGDTVTVTGYFGGSVTLTRVDENTMKVLSCSENFVENVPVGTPFHFTPEA